MNQKGKMINKLNMRSIRFRIFSLFVLLTAILLIILNTYPINQIRKQIISAKEIEMRANFGALSLALEGSEFLDYETAATALSILDLGRNQRVLVTNERGAVVFDNLKSSDMIGKTILFSEVIEALYANDVFRCQYDHDAFIYRVSCAISRGGRVVGAVYAYEYDTDSALLLNETELDIQRISLAVSAGVAIIIIVFTTSLRREFDRVLEGVNQIREGNYDYRINMDSMDELGIIAHEFDKTSAQLGKNEAIRRQFVSDASHELKTPLASIKLLSDSILQASDMKVEDVREFLGDISDEIDRLTRITDDLLYISRIENDGVAEGICDLPHAVIRASEILRGNAQKQRVKIDYDIPETAYVSGNGDLIYQAIFNVMENAIKYNKADGTIHITMAVMPEKTALYIADTGIGMEEDELERIFDRFYRVDKMRSRESRGTGLGLSIVGECMDSVGGHLEVSSTLGEGSCFTLYFNNAPEEETGEGDES